MTGFTAEQAALLAQPLKRGFVQERTQANRTFSYLEAWHVIAEANRIFGFDGWNREMMDCRCVAERETKIGQAERQRDGWRVGYIARVRVTVGHVVREGSGYGSGIDVDLGTAHESALKEAESDAMKRALMTFGNQFGLALYDKAQANVETPTWPAATPPRPTTAGSRSIPSGSPAGENAATRDATSAALSPTPSSTGNGGTPPNIAKFLAGESYEIDPQVAGGMSAWQRYYLKIAAATKDFEQYAKLQNDNEVHIQKFARAVRREVFDDFLKRCQAIEAKYFPNEPPLVSKEDAAKILQQT